MSAIVPMPIIVLKTCPAWFTVRSLFSINQRCHANVILMKTLSLVALLACLVVPSANGQDQVPSPKESQAEAARTGAGCGLPSVQFDVKSDTKQHPMSQPDPGKGLVYFAQVETQNGAIIRKGWVTTRVGIDGAWVGANHGKSYFFVAVDPGSHVVCTDWQSGHKLYSQQGAAMNLSVEAGKIYYIRSTVMEITANQRTPGMKIELIDSSEGQLLVSSSALNSANIKK